MKEWIAFWKRFNISIYYKLYYNYNNYIIITVYYTYISMCVKSEKYLQASLIISHINFHLMFCSEIEIDSDTQI